MRKLFLIAAGIVTIFVFAFNAKFILTTLVNYKPKSEVAKKMELHQQIGDNIETACHEWIKGSELKGNNAFRTAVRLGRGIDGSSLEQIKVFTRIMEVYTRKYTEEEQQRIARRASYIKY